MLAMGTQQSTWGYELPEKAICLTTGGLHSTVRLPPPAELMAASVERQTRARVTIVHAP